MKQLFYVLLFLNTLTSCNKEYESKDLQTYNLFGKVKSVVVTRISEFGDERILETLTFSEGGELLVEGASIIRDSSGYICSIEYDFGGTSFKYDENGNMIERSDWDTSTIRECPTKLDENNNPVESEQYGEMGIDEGESPAAKFTYKYLNEDDHGNWTLRRVSYNDLYDESWSRVWSEKREIEYYR